jgi:hypothetical protein
MMKLRAELLRSRALPILLLAMTAFILSGCGDAFGGGVAWEDLNCNGVKEPDEPPLAGVCMWSSTYTSAPTPSAEDCAKEYLHTDSEGMGGAFWQPGMSCNDVFVFAQAPEGYDPTTDTVANQACWNEFGFAPEGTCPPHRSVTAQELVGRAQMRCLAWAVGLPGVLVLLALGYRRFRRDTLARRDRLSGE